MTRVLFAFSLALLLGAVGSAVSAPVPRSLSSSRQFIVYGTEAKLRGGLCDLAERTKKTALTLLGQSDSWRTPIVIQARFPKADQPESPDALLQFSQTGAGLKIQLDLQVGAEGRAAIERELLRAIFLEIMYRAHSDVAAGIPYAQPPDWLLEGTLALGAGREAVPIPEGLGTSVDTGNLMPLDQLLRQRPELLESPSRALYRAYAAALVLTLIDLPGGRAKLARFLVDLPRVGNDPMTDLREHFPSLGANSEELQKTWGLRVVQLASANRYRLLGCEETERELVEALRLSIIGAEQSSERYTLEEFSRFVRLPAAPGALRKVAQDLLLLSGRANPLYRPVIAEYGQIAGLLARGKTKKIPGRLAELREMREHITRRMGAIGDYLNWFEATQARTASGAFREYLNAAEMTGKEEKRRRDPISVYLDAFEAQLQD